MSQVTQPNNTLVRFILDETDDNGDRQTVKGQGRSRELFGGPKHKVVREQQYGMSAHAPKGSVGVAIAINGNPDQMVLLGFEHKDHRPKELPEGEVKWYAKFGQVMHFKADGSIVISVAGGAKIILKDDKAYIDAIVHLGGGEGDDFKSTSQEGTLDTDGDAEVSNFATRVKTR